MFLQTVEEIAAAVGALHLPVTEQIHFGQQVFFEHAGAFRRIAAIPVIAIGEMKQVNVPILRHELFADHLLAKTIGRRDLGSSAFAGMKERFVIDFLRDGIVNDVASLDAIVVVNESTYRSRTTRAARFPFAPSPIDPETSIM